MKILYVVGTVLPRMMFALAAIALLPAQARAQGSTGVTADKILLGQSVALTGPAAQLGIQMRNGIKAYLDYVNEKGGVHGRRIELITLDDGHEPSRSAPNTKKLIEEEKVFGLIGYVGTPTVAAAMPIHTQAKVPLVGPVTGAEILRMPFNRYIFHVRASYYDETERIIKQLVSIGAKNIAVFYENDSYGQAGLQGVEIATRGRGMKISAVGAVERNTIDVAKAVKAINAVKPDAVVIFSAYTSCAEFIRQMRRADSTATFYNVSFVGSKALSDALGNEGSGIAISQVVPFPWGTAVPVVKEYQQRSAKAGFKDFNFSAIEGYLVAKVFVEGLRRTGRNLTREAFINALEKMEAVDLGGFYLGYSPTNHAGSDFVDLTIIGRDGKFLR